MFAHGQGAGKLVYPVAADDFQRASLGSNWSVILGNSSIVASADYGLSAASIGIATWVGTSLTADQFCEATLAADWDTDLLAQICVRRRSSDSARYAFHYDSDFNDGNPTVQWEIKYDGVASQDTRSLAGDTTRPGPVPGDTLRLEIRDYELRAYHNGELIFNVTDTDASKIASGPPALVGRASVGASIAYPAPVFSSWRGGSLA